MKRTRLAVVAATLSAALVTTGPQAIAGDYVVDRSTFSIDDSLTGKAGDAENGRKVAVNRKKGNCLACHVMPIPEQPFHGRPQARVACARLFEERGPLLQRQVQRLGQERIDLVEAFEGIIHDAI